MPHRVFHSRSKLGNHTTDLYEEPRDGTCGEAPVVPREGLPRCVVRGDDDGSGEPQLEVYQGTMDTRECTCGEGCSASQEDYRWGPPIARQVAQ
jgi:hypothetical protein